MSLARCSGCGLFARLEEGRGRCDRCYADLLTDTLKDVDIALIMAGWAPENSPVGMLVADIPRQPSSVDGDTAGMSRDDFIDRLAAAARRA